MTFFFASENEHNFFKSLTLLFLVFILIVQSNSRLSGQISVAGSIQEYLRLNHAPPGQKIYLHLDRAHYLQGDTIWFKAYTWYGYDQLPDTLNAVLYVDLLDPDGKTKFSRKLLIYKGTSHGEFCLDTTIIPGNYTIRAYTRWMQNSNTGEPFYQSITVSQADQIFIADCTTMIQKHAGLDTLLVSLRFNEFENNGDLKNIFSQRVSYSLSKGGQLLDTGHILAENNNEHIIKYGLSKIDQTGDSTTFEFLIRNEKLNFSKQVRIQVYDKFDIQFFPEGGRMVNGLSGKVAFKAIGADGLSREVRGVIETDDGDVITVFESKHKGMGTFMLNPQSQKKYFASVMHNNRKYVIPLPTASDNGTAISVSLPENGYDTYMTLRYKSSDTNNQKYLIGSAYGKIWFGGIIKAAKDSTSVRIPVELLPEGVCILTVLNGNYRPEGERLIFVDKKKQFKIEAIADSTSYATRSRVTLLIKTTGQDGSPLQTDLSLSVVDREQEPESINFNGISVFKLLDSELRGYIEDAGSYFRNDGSIDYESLDLLLLTHGYRKFLPRNPNPMEQKFQSERSFSISGNVKLNGSKAREANYSYKDVSLIFMCNSSEQFLAQTNPDSLGQFRLEIPLFFGKAHAFLQAKSVKGKPLDCIISLDEVSKAAAFSKPFIESYDISFPEIESVSRLQAIKMTEFSKIPVAGEKVVTVPEVTVTAKNKNWYLEFAANAEKIADLDQLDPKGSKYKDLMDLLVKEFGAKEYFESQIDRYMVKFPVISGKWSFGVPIYLVNGVVLLSAGELGRERIAAALTQVATFPVNEIKNIMVLPPGQIPSHYASPDVAMDMWQSMVVIETYTKDFYRGDPTGIITFMLDGLDSSRQFYSPRYDGPSSENQIYDSRATLYWNPSIITDENGVAKIDFYTSDRETSLSLVINGIEAGTGNSGHKKLLINSNSAAPLTPYLTPLTGRRP